MSIPNEHHWLLEELLDLSIKVQEADFGDLQILDRENALLRIKCIRNLPVDFVKTFLSVPIYGASVCARAFRSASPVFVEDVLVDPAFSQYRALAAASGVRSVYSIPLSIQGEIVGVVSTHFCKPRTVPERGVREVQMWLREHQHIFARFQAGNQARPSESGIGARKD